MQNLWRQISTLYAALLIGQVLFALAIIVLIYSREPVDTSELPLQYPMLGLLIVGLCIMTAFYFNNLRQNQAQSLQIDLGAKLLHYRTSILMRSAIIESGNLFCLILVFLTQGISPLLFFAVGLVAFVYFRPTLDNMIQMYHLTAQEALELRRQVEAV